MPAVLDGSCTAVGSTPAIVARPDMPVEETGTCRSLETRPAGQEMLATHPAYLCRQPQRLAISNQSPSRVMYLPNRLAVRQEWTGMIMSRSPT